MDFSIVLELLKIIEVIAKVVIAVVDLLKKREKKPPE